MPKERHGYVEKTVNGKDFKIKKHQQGTESSSVARNLLNHENVLNALVEHDGTVQVHVEKEGEEFAFGYTTDDDMLPDGWQVERLIVHPNRGNRASAHVTIEEA